jgi:hypothetical protein
MTKISAIKCPTCKDIVFSRARHDYRPCSCGEVAMDGGFEYVRIAYKADFERVQIEIHQTRQQLFDDWNFKKDKFGIIKA